jgi:hypothetical protein
VTRKSVKHGSEGGCWKSARKGNSLAAYPTSRTVLYRRRGGRLPRRPELGGTIISSQSLTFFRVWYRRHILLS